MTPAELATRLSLFPLPVVLFPGAMMPLHIFEPRYRRMLEDCLASDRQFGMLFHAEGSNEPARAGDVGCIAYVEQSDVLDDGRSNIIVSGRDRFAIESLLTSGEPYAVALVRAYEDHPSSSKEIATLAERVGALFMRVAGAARALAGDTNPMPTLSTDPTALSFAIPSMIDLDGEARQKLLVSRSAEERLREIEKVITDALSPMEARAKVHARAKSNGAGLHAH